MSMLHGYIHPPHINETLYLLCDDVIDMYARTVCGEVPVDNLGITLCHEHILVDGTIWFNRAPLDKNDKRRIKGPVKMENLGAIRRVPYYSRDNLSLLDSGVALEELRHYKRAGGGTVVDCTTIGIKRDVKKIKEISRATGLNIVVGTGFYVDATHPKYVGERTADELAQLMTRELESGVGNTGIKCGIIGEIGTGWPITPNEEKVLRAAAHAQEKTGASINVHPYPFEKHAGRVLEILQEEGADLTRVVLSHQDNCGPDPDYASSLAKRGAYVEYDCFGSEGDIYYVSHGIIEVTDLDRTRAIVELVRRGYGSQLVISHDTCFKIQLKKYGGYGYDHILTNILPLFRRAGLTEEQIEAILVQNPKNILGF
jgi:phosphotriesterase-related protein